MKIEFITPEPCLRLSQYGKGLPITCACSVCSAKNQTPAEALKAVKLANSSVYEVKKNGKWSKVRATNMKGLNDWAASNGFNYWRMVGMMSRAETLESQNLEVVI